MSYAQVSFTENGKEVYIKTDGVRVEDVLSGSGTISMVFGANQPSYRYVYRKMGMDEYKAAIDSQMLPPALGRNHTTAEKWFSESLEHTRQFENRAVKGGPQVVAEIGLDRQGYAEFKEHSIPQRGARALQPADGRPFNIFNKEHLETHRSGKVNIGIKGRQNLDEFNKSVVKIHKVDEHGFMNKTKELRWIRRNKMAAVGGLIGVAINAASVTLSIIDDNGKFGPSTTITISEIGMGAAGAAIGAAVFSLVPIVGTIIGGLIGSIIGNLIGQGIANLIFGVRSVAPGPGPPMLDTEPYPSGAPSMGHNVYSGAPSIGHRVTHGAPSTGHRISSGAAKMNFRTHK